MELEENAAIKEIQAVFASGDESQIHDSIAYIHEFGSVKMVSLLFELLSTTNNGTLQKEALDCLSDTKDKSAIPLFIDALKSEKLANFKTSLLATMWQANLDFSEHTDLFIDILINDDYETAIEAFTLIDVCAENLSKEKKMMYKQKINKVLATENSTKKGLLQKMIESLD